MEIKCLSQPLTVRALFQQILLFVPQALREPIERELPEFSLQALQLGLEVMAAEKRGVRYSAAVTQAEFLKMGRVYFGAGNLLQWRLPPPIREALEAMLTRATTGDFDPTRKLLFAIATRKSDPEAALCRFALWVAVRFNLLVHTWRAAGMEAFGALDEIEDNAEDVLRQLLDVRDMHESDVRPLHVLISEMLMHMCISANSLAKEAMTAVDAEIMERLHVVRGLDARDAVMFWPGRSDAQMGSQQVVDRYPQHFTSANAMEQRRHRFSRVAGEISPAEDRFIDVVQRFSEGIS